MQLTLHRGVEWTEPSVNVFPDEAEGTRLLLLNENLPLVNTTSDAVYRQHAFAQVLGNLAELRTKDASAYVSTALVARDMLSIVTALGRDKLQYLGFS